MKERNKKKLVYQVRLCFFPSGPVARLPRGKPAKKNVNKNRDSSPPKFQNFQDGVRPAVHQPCHPFALHCIALRRSHTEQTREKKTHTRKHTNAAQSSPPITPSAASPSSLSLYPCCRIYPDPIILKPETPSLSKPL